MEEPGFEPRCPTPMAGHLTLPTKPGSALGGVRGNISFSLKSYKDIFLSGSSISSWGGPSLALEEANCLGKWL